MHYTALMRLPSSLRLVAFASFALIALSSAACHRVVVDDVRGPDGGDWKRISCNHLDKRCFRTAAELCPNGYYFAKAEGPSPEVVVTSRSHDGALETTETASDPKFTQPHPQTGVNVKTLPPQETWDSEMYSRKGGTILVQCADARASASR